MWAYFASRADAPRTWFLLSTYHHLKSRHSFHTSKIAATTTAHSHGICAIPHHCSGRDRNQVSTRSPESSTATTRVPPSYAETARNQPRLSGAVRAAHRSVRSRFQTSIEDGCPLCTNVRGPSGWTAANWPVPHHRSCTRARVRASKTHVPSRTGE